MLVVLAPLGARALIQRLKEHTFPARLFRAGDVTWSGGIKGVYKREAIKLGIQIYEPARFLIYMQVAYFSENGVICELISNFVH